MRYMLTLLMLAGCATTETVWVKPGATNEAFYQDQGQCRAQAFGAPGMYTMQVAMIYSSCMQGRGWYTEERPIQR
jgi:hypothetical protein